MPSSLFVSININLKALRLLAIILLTPLTFYAQELTGLWIGTISNDSTTIRKDQSFEVALTEYRGKVYGYSRSEFIVNDTLYYVVKRVKGTIIGDMCEVKDDEIIAFNFPTKLDKGIKVVSTFFRNKIDSTWYLAGKWKTTKTKNYYSVTGSVDLQGETDLTRSKIFPHLEELKLTKDVAFYEESKKEPPSIVKIRQVIADKKTTPIITIDPQSTTSITSSLPKDIQPEIVKPAPALTKNIPANTETEKVISSTVVNNNSIDAYTEIKDEEKRATAIKNEQQVGLNKPTITINKPANTETEKIGSSTAVNNNSIDVYTERKDEEKKATAIKNEQQVALNKPAITINKPVNTETEKIGSSTAVNNNSIEAYTERKDEEKKATAIKNEQQVALNKTNIPNAKPANNEPVNINSKPEAKNDFGDLLPEIKAETKKSTVIKTEQQAAVNKPAIATVKPDTKPTAIDVSTVAKTATKKQPVDAHSPAAFVDERKSEFAQEVTFKSDSLEISLYDNAEIDGDTVSVLLNGELIIAKQVLKATAFKKTIYIPSGSDKLSLVLYAENLGKYPPNTGLMTVRDGDDVYQVRFSADLQKNAGVIFRKKKN